MLNLSATLIAIKNQVQHKPVEIHDIYLGSQTEEDFNTLHFVGFYRTISFFTYYGHAAQDYTPLYIERTSIKKTSSGEIDRVSYRVDNVNKGMGAYAAAHDFRNKRIVTRLIFRDNLSSYLDAKIIFDGFIQSISFPEKKMEATCVPKIGSLNYETGWSFQIQCNAKFGDAYCTVDKNSLTNKITGAVTGGTLNAIIDTDYLIQANDFWNWGTIYFTSGANDGDARRIVDFDSTTKTLTLDYNLENLPAVGDTYTLYRGCDKTLNMCQNTYLNEGNYHGFHTIPLRK